VLNELTKLIREVDLLVTVTVDRLTRDIFDGAEFINKIYKKGEIITSLDLPADYNSPFHKYMLVQYILLAEHDYKSRRVRAQAGIDKAREAKKYKGRKPVYSGVEREEIYKKFEAGHISPEDLCKIYKISRSTLFRIVREYRTATVKLKELTSVNSSL
jgi:DNA invertase Pin-like site-specific DNA recombinase